MDEGRPAHREYRHRSLVHARLPPCGSHRGLAGHAYVVARIHDSSPQLLLRKPSHDAAAPALMANTGVSVSHSCFSSFGARQPSITVLELLFSAFALCLAGSAGSVAGAQTAEFKTIV